jgi:hypothetical protein
MTKIIPREGGKAIDGLLIERCAKLLINEPKVGVLPKESRGLKITSASGGSVGQKRRTGAPAPATRE